MDEKTEKREKDVFFHFPPSKSIFRICFLNLNSSNFFISVADIGRSAEYKITAYTLKEPPSHELSNHETPMRKEGLWGPLVQNY